VAQASYSLPVPTNGPWAPVNQGFYALPALNMAFRINQAATP
jgi:hypothetical protein